MATIETTIVSNSSFFIEEVAGTARFDDGEAVSLPQGTQRAAQSKFWTHPKQVCSFFLWHSRNDFNIVNLWRPSPCNDFAT